MSLQRVTGVDVHDSPGLRRAGRAATAVVHQVGYVGYGLRARAAGSPTVSMRGVAVWHMAWSDKDDAIDWQAYFHLRNRLVGVHPRVATSHPRG